MTFLDRKSTRLNSSHVKISYAVFCLKKKTNPSERPMWRRFPCATPLPASSFSGRRQVMSIAWPLYKHSPAQPASTALSFFFKDTATTEIYTLSLHDALPISPVTTASWCSPRVCCNPAAARANRSRSEEHTSELQSREKIVCRLLLEKKK